MTTCLLEKGQPQCPGAKAATNPWHCVDCARRREAELKAVADAVEAKKAREEPKP